MGRHHARVYLEVDSANLVAVVDVDKNVVRKIARKCKCKCYADVDSAQDGLLALDISLKAIDNAKHNQKERR